MAFPFLEADLELILHIVSQSVGYQLPENSHSKYAMDLANYNDD